MSRRKRTLPARSTEPLWLDLIGYWASREQDGNDGDAAGFPDPTDLVGAWDPEERARVGAYLESGVVVRVYMGVSGCRLCGEIVGSRELADGRWVWPEGLPHYVRVHAVRLPEAFVDTVRASEGRVPPRVHEELGGSPELWVEGPPAPLSTVGRPKRPIQLRTAVWLDWVNANIRARPAPDAIGLDEARAICAGLSHRTWTPRLEVAHGRWRVSCDVAGQVDVFYTECCSATALERRLIPHRVPNPDAILEAGHAQAIAAEYDGSWGQVRLVWMSDAVWLICFWPLGVAPPTRARMEEFLEPPPEFGWKTFHPDGSETEAVPPPDEITWRMVLTKIRAAKERAEVSTRG